MLLRGCEEASRTHSANRVMGEQKMMGRFRILPQGRRIRAAVILVGLLLCILAAVPAAAQTAGGAEGLDGGQLKLDVVYGYQGTAKSGRYLPLKIRIENPGGAPFSGTLSVLTMESDYEMYRYEYPLNLESGESFAKDMSISLGARIDQMYVKVMDQEGREAASKRLKLNVSMETAELFVGILSDTPDRLQYLNGVGVNYSTLRTRTIEMSARTLPSQEMELDQLDVLLISNFDTGTLSGDQVKAVWEWVSKGGVLLLGTGERAEDVMRAFGDDLLLAPLPLADLQEINMGVEFAKDSPKGATIPLECTDVYMLGASEVLSSDELSVLTSVTVDNGLVGAAIYDFVDIEAFCQENVSYVDNLFSSLLGEDRINYLVSSSDGTNSSQYWSVQSLINTGDINRLPKVGLYTMAALAYVALVGPGLYFFLKQRGMRRYYPRAVILLALCCTGMVYFMGLTTRFNGPFFTYATIKDMDEDNVVETTFINMQAPYNKPYSVELDPSYMVQPITRSAYYDAYYGNMQVPKFTGTEEPDVNLRFDESATRVSARNVGAFVPLYFQMERKTENTGKEGFTGEIHCFDGTVSGTLTNGYNHPVDDVAVLMYNQMVMVGHMEAGETVELDNREVVYGVMNFGYPMAEQITGASRYREGDLNDAEYVHALERTNLLTFYIGNYLTGYHSEARVVGFSQNQQGGGFLAKKGYETYGSTLITSSVKVDYEQDGLVYRSGLQKNPNVLSGEYYARSNTMYGVTPLILEYYLGNDTEVERVDFHQLSDKVIQSLRYNYTVPFVGNIYFYNYDTGNYDPMDIGVEKFGREALEPYLSPGNTLTVKYVYTNPEDYSWNIILPILTVIGRNK